LPLEIAGCHPLRKISQIEAKNYNEGWNAYWADMAAHGGRRKRPPSCTRLATLDTGARFDS